MAVPLNLPKLGVTMAEGTLVEWCVADGDRVHAGQDLYRVVSDKADEVIEAPLDGVVRILAAEGSTYAVGTRVGEIEPDQPDERRRRS